jgi:hypothetical protein
MGAFSGPGGAWRITAGPYEVACPEDGERMAWIWVIARGRAVRTVRVSVTSEAWRARTGGAAPKLVRDAIASRGATAVIEAARGCDEPAALLEVGIAGIEECRPDG